MASLAQRRALNFLVKNPGATATRYARQAGISQPGAHQLLARMQAAGFVSKARDDHVVGYYATRTGQAALTRPDQSTRARVDEGIIANPGISRRQLAKTLGVSTTTVQYHLQRLRLGG